MSSRAPFRGPSRFIPPNHGLDGDDLRWLRGLLSHALQASLASTLLLAGCDSEPRTSVLDEPETPAIELLDVSRGERPECVEDRWNLAGDLILTRRVDYLADRAFVTGPVGAPLVIHSEVGDACGSAKDLESCRLALRDAAPQLRQRHLLTTEGDTVRIWPLPGARELLGAITTEAEALWLLLADNHKLPCGTEVASDGSSFEIHSAGQTDGLCNIEPAVVQVHRDGSITKAPGQTAPKRSCPAVGRTPEGLLACASLRGATVLGEHFASMAHLEAASVPAFATIGHELQVHGASARLVRAAQAARRDELRHAFIAARLAQRFGAQAPRAEVALRPVRDLEAFALDNAVEGCVRETYAALTASHQAVAARDRKIRRALQGIAADETRHAALSFAVARWVTPQLTRAGARRVRAAQREAIEHLRCELRADVPEALRSTAGVPDASTATRLHQQLAAQLWNEPRASALRG